MTVEDLKTLVDMFKDIVKTRTGQNFPTDPIEQLWGGIGAVFGSWQADRAITYRRLENIPGRLGNSGQRTVHGLWQHGRRLRHRRCIYARPFHG